MKKLLKSICIVLSIVGVISLSSCKKDSSSNNMYNTSQIESSDKSNLLENESEMREKISKLEKDFTEKQVHEIMGEPDEIPPTGIYYEYYFIDDTRKIVIGYFTDAISVVLVDTKANKRELIL